MPPTNTEIQSSLEKVEDQLHNLALAVGRIETYIKQHDDDLECHDEQIEELKHTVNGNGTEGLTGKVTHLWREREDKRTTMGNILLTLLGILGGAAATWYFTVG